jgi:hypothetical protein
MKIFATILVFTFLLTTIEGFAASKGKNSRKPSYVVKNQHLLPKKMPRLKAKQERIDKAPEKLAAVVTLAE